MLKGTLLYIFALYLLGLAVTLLREDEYDKGYTNGRLDTYRDLQPKIPNVNAENAPVHRES